LDRQVAPSAQKKPKFFYGYIIVAVGFIILVVMDGTLYSFGVFFEPLTREFGWTRAETAGAFSLLTGLGGFLYIVTGRLTDSFGPRLVVTVCGLLFGVGYMLISRINTIWQLYIFLGVIVAMGDSGGFVPLSSTVAKWFVSRRGLMTGIVISGIGVGTVIMPLVASRLLASHGWRTSYLILGIVILVVIVAASQFLKRDPRQAGLEPYESKRARQGSVVLEVGGLTLREAFRTRQFWMLGIMFFGFGFGQMAIMAHIVPRAIDVGIAAVTAATILAVIGGASTVGRIVLGSASDRIGNKPLVIISFILLLIALFWLIFTTELWEFYISAVLFGLGYGALVAVVSPLVAEFFGLKAHGTILGTVTFIITLGGAIGPVLMGRVFDVTGSYYYGFMVCTALMGLSLILSSLLKPGMVKRVN